ncbi:MAG: zinc-dependent peptidase, partial [Bacteroidales bacterium]|nr:zinc-dependent peptidase [Bacteroidales bacterium]
AVYVKSTDKNNGAGSRIFLNIFGRRLLKKRAEVHETLSKYFDYYQHLNEKDKELFVRRVAFFAGTTNFYAQNGLNLTEIHIMMISATFVQLTFGLKKSILSYFNDFHIFPRHFLNYHTNHYHKGEISMQGSLSLSWEDYLEGQKYPKDGLNVGLHEMAHALSMEITHSGMGYRHLVIKLQAIYYRARNEINNPRYRVMQFREYAYTNMHEYFAVVTEVFFEQAELMREQHPELYKEMCILYKQDPASGIFRLESAKPII